MELWNELGLSPLEKERFQHRIYNSNLELMKFAEMSDLIAEMRNDEVSASFISLHIEEVLAERLREDRIQLIEQMTKDMKLKTFNVDQKQSKLVSKNINFSNSDEVEEGDEVDDEDFKEANLQHHDILDIHKLKNVLEALTPIKRQNNRLKSSKQLNEHSVDIHKILKRFKRTNKSLNLSKSPEIPSPSKNKWNHQVLNRINDDDIVNSLQNNPHQVSSYDQSDRSEEDNCNDINISNQQNRIDQKELVELQEQIKQELRSKITSLQTQLMESTIFNNSIQEKLKQKDEVITNIQNERIGKDRIIANLEEKLKNLEQMKDQIIHYQDLLTSTEDNRRKLQHDINLLLDNNAIKDKNIEMLENSIQNQQETIKTLTDHNTELQTRIDKTTHLHDPSWLMNNIQSPKKVNVSNPFNSSEHRDATGGYLGIGVDGINRISECLDDELFLDRCRLLHRLRDQNSIISLQQHLHKLAPEPLVSLSSHILPTNISNIDNSINHQKMMNKTALLEQEVETTHIQLDNKEQRIKFLTDKLEEASSHIECLRNMLLKRIEKDRLRHNSNTASKVSSRPSSPNNELNTSVHSNEFYNHHNSSFPLTPIQKISRAQDRSSHHKEEDISKGIHKSFDYSPQRSQKTEDYSHREGRKEKDNNSIQSSVDDISHKSHSHRQQTPTRINSKSLNEVPITPISSYPNSRPGSRGKEDNGLNSTTGDIRIYEERINTLTNSLERNRRESLAIHQQDANTIRNISNKLSMLMESYEREISKTEELKHLKISLQEHLLEEQHQKQRIMQLQSGLIHTKIQVQNLRSELNKLRKGLLDNHQDVSQIIPSIRAAVSTFISSPKTTGNGMYTVIHDGNNGTNKETGDGYHTWLISILTKASFISSEMLELAEKAYHSIDDQDNLQVFHDYVSYSTQRSNTNTSSRIETTSPSHRIINEAIILNEDRYELEEMGKLKEDLVKLKISLSRSEADRLGLELKLREERIEHETELGLLRSENEDLRRVIEEIVIEESQVSDKLEPGVESMGRMMEQLLRGLRTKSEETRKRVEERFEELNSKYAHLLNPQLSDDDDGR